MKHSEETKRKMSQTRKGMRHSEETIEKIAKAHRGMKRSEEAKQSMSKNHADFSGKKNPNYGNRYSEEIRKKISDAARGRIPSEKTKKKISEALKGEKNHNWKGGERLTNGYILVLKPKHPNADSKGYVRRGHLVMEKRLGRCLKKGEIVHHINSITNDDRPENLILFSNIGDHTAFHSKLRKRNKRRLNKI